jgi:flavodoxin
MKNLLKRVILTITVLMSFVGCVEAQQNTKTLSIVKMENVLIVYLSRTNNTKAVAEIIQQNTGGTLVGLELETPYPEEYRAIVDQVAKENQTGFLPPLKTKIENIEKYDTIFIGFPNWGMQLPPPLKSFLSEYDLKGKTIIPFNTNAGYGIGNGIETIKRLCPNSNVLKEFSTVGGIERDGVLFVMEGDKKIKVENQVKKWLNEVIHSKK